MNGAPPNRRDAPKRATQVVLAVALVTAVSGYFMGLRQVASVAAASKTTLLQETNQNIPEEPSPDSHVPAAAPYREMARLPKANKDWINSLSFLREPVDKESIPPVDQKARMNRRAFDGAPPTIPHPIEQISSTSCLACHEKGTVIRGKIASAISHPHFQNCTQCHAPAGAEIPFPSGNALALNEFAGLAPSFTGSRGFEGAPPVIPHSVLMRDDCMSCHGPTGSARLRVTHPDRQSCLQCHALNPLLDQRPSQ